ncbi:Gti1/Pac2 family-domain-containing protein [Mycena leptocephala]|nr:Gti1/Pac2 family-domain-containing protein [Mycena leptocephala]
MPHAECASFVTHPALHIRDITDAHRVLEAVRLNILPLIKRRLVAHERAQLRSGNVFVWEESEYEDGLVRWTEGRRWSQSKMRGDCLFYEEKIGTTEAEKQAKAVRRAMKASDSSEPIPMPPKRKDRPAKVDGLIKQTYSVAVQIPGALRTKKWHVVAYYSARDSFLLPVVEDYDYLRNIRIPDGVFISSIRPAGGTFEWFPRPYAIPSSGSSSPTQRSVSPAIRHSELESCSNFRPSRGDESSVVLPAIYPVPSPTTLPSLASLGHLSPRNPVLHKPSARDGPCYHSFTCSDDRRILDRFRVVI